MERKYKLACVVGRFQPFHKGHKRIVDKALEVADKVVICLGSSQEKRTPDNPFSDLERLDLILSAYSEEEQSRLNFISLVDIGAGNSPIWGTYIKNAVRLKFGCAPDVFVQGSEENRNSWFKDDKVIIIDRKELEVSGSLVRSLFDANVREIKAKFYRYPGKEALEKEQLRELLNKSFTLCRKNMYLFMPEGSADRLIELTINEILNQ